MGGRPGFLIIRHVPCAFRKEGQPFRKGSAPVHSELHLRRQHTEPLGLTGSVHQHNPRLGVPGGPCQTEGNRWRQRDVLHVRRLPEGNGPHQQAVHKAHARRRRGRPWIRLPYSYLQHHQGLRLEHRECPASVRDDRTVRHSVLPELRKFRSQSKRRALNVLPSQTRQA